MRGAHPVAAFRNHASITLRDLSERTGVAESYLSEIERGLKPGSAATLSRIATALGTTIDSLVMQTNASVAPEIYFIDQQSL